MKKILIAVCMFFMMLSGAIAAESITQSMYRTPTQPDGSSIVVVSVAWVTAADGTLTATAFEDYVLKELRGLSCYMAITDPGATAPTDNYDITLPDSYGVDIFGGQLANRDSSATEQAVPRLGQVYGTRPMLGNTVTFTLTGNSVNSATGTTYFLFIQ